MIARQSLLFVMAAAATLSAAQGAPPPDLSAMAAKARVNGRLVTWCRGQFRSGRSNAYAAAVTSPGGGGRYLVLDRDALMMELAPYKDAPDLSCYTPAEARTLNETVRSSETISGGIAPAFPTTVVCAFVEDTRATCWQYSPASRTFVKVGEWQT